MARVSNKVRTAQPLDQVSIEILEYQVVRDQVDELEKRKKSLRDSLMDTIKSAGEPDDQGHLWLELGADVNGVSALQAERRVSQSLNEERALEVLERLGLTEECTRTVRVVDEDAVLAAKYEDRIAEDDIDEMFDHRIVWALKLK